MSFIVENKVWLRLFVLGLFILCILGPWAFDLVHVPAQYICEKPFVRLYGDFCGSPMTGFGVFKWVTSGFSYTLAELMKGNFAAQLPELIVVMCVLVILLPFITNLLLIGNRNSRRLQIIHVIVWGVACLPVLAIFFFQSIRDQELQFFYLLWGVLLYILLAIGAMVFEILVLRLDTKPGMAA